jgi:peptidoglycan/xylan/chitin deacetylase (PgdA/CDA1 family)
MFFDIPVLAYHQVTPGTLSRNLGEFAVSSSQFGRQMRYLHEHGYVCLPLVELLRHSDHKRSCWKRTVALTFDDGYENFFTLAYPILRDYRFTATVFVVTNKIHAQNDREREADSQYLTWEQIEALQQSGITFGSHTYTHSRLPGLPREAIQRELTDSKECLEARLKQEIKYLAYPYGASNSEIQEIAMAVGYEAAWGVDRGKSGRFNIWRRLCRSDDTMLTYIFKLTRWYHYPGHLREETAAGQFLRKVKHTLGL